MSEPIEEPTVFSPYEIALDPPLNGIDSVTVTREAEDYVVFDGKHAAPLAGHADVTAAIRAEIESWYAPAIPPVPQIVGSGQIRVAMLRDGIDPASIDAIIDAIEDETIKQEAYYLWNNASEFHRDNNLINMIAVIMGLTSERVDNLFRAAPHI